MNRHIENNNTIISTCGEVVVNGNNVVEGQGRHIGIPSTIYM